MTLEFWAIRHEPTGGYLPQRNDTRGGGHTHSLPSTFLPPRLFTSEGDAKKALTWWLKGITSKDYDEVWRLDQPDKLGLPTREKSDMQITQMMVYSLESNT